MADNATKKNSTYCPDCGPVTVPHWVERMSARIDAILAVTMKGPEAMRKTIKPAFNALKPGRSMPAISAALATVGIVKIIDAPDEKNNWRARVLWEEATRRGITMREIRPFGLSREFFYASYGGDTRAFDGLPARGRRMMFR